MGKKDVWRGAGGAGFGRCAASEGDSSRLGEVEGGVVLSCRLGGMEETRRSSEIPPSTEYGENWNRKLRMKGRLVDLFIYRSLFNDSKFVCPLCFPFTFSRTHLCSFLDGILQSSLLRQGSSQPHPSSLEGSCSCSIISCSCFALPSCDNWTPLPWSFYNIY